MALIADEHDSVRLIAVEAAISLAKKLNKDDINTHVLPSVIASVKASILKTGGILTLTFYHAGP